MGPSPEKLKGVMRLGCGPEVAPAFDEPGLKRRHATLPPAGHVVRMVRDERPLVSLSLLLERRSERGELASGYQLVVPAEDTEARPVDDDAGEEARFLPELQQLLHAIALIPESLYPSRHCGAGRAEAPKAKVAET